MSVSLGVKASFSWISDLTLERRRGSISPDITPCLYLGTALETHWCCFGYSYGTEVAYCFACSSIDFSSSKSCPKHSRMKSEALGSTACFFGGFRSNSASSAFRFAIVESKKRRKSGKVGKDKQFGSERYRISCGSRSNSVGGVGKRGKWAKWGKCDPSVARAN